MDINNIVRAFVPDSVKVPFSPTERYTKKGLKPEEYPLSSLQSIAQAVNIAEKNNALPKEILDLFLANQLVENRPNDFGVNEYYTDMDIAPFDNDTALDKKYGWTKAQREGAYPLKRDENLDKAEVNVSDNDYIVWRGKGQRINPKGTVPIYFDEERNLANAKLAVAVLRDKHETYKGSTLNAYRRWNGGGPGAQNHIEKVQELQRMLQEPANQAMMQEFVRAKSQSPVQLLQIVDALSSTGPAIPQK